MAIGLYSILAAVFQRAIAELDDDEEDAGVVVATGAILEASPIRNYQAKTIWAAADDWKEDEDKVTGVILEAVPPQWTSIPVANFGLTATVARQACVGSCSQANYLLRNSAMDDSIGGSQGVTGLRVQ